MININKLVRYISNTVPVPTISWLAGVLAAGPLGYAGGSGAGGAVTQLVSKATGVALNALVGQITMNNAALGAGVEATFTWTNTQIGVTDQVLVTMSGGGTTGSYGFSANISAAGSVDITVTNLSAGSLSEAIVLNVMVLKGAIT